MPAMPALDGVSAGAFVQFAELILPSQLLKRVTVIETNSEEFSRAAARPHRNDSNQ